MRFAVIADEHVPRIFVKELRANGFDVSWIDGGYGAGRTDVEHLEASVEAGAVIVTNDTDFVRLHEEYDHGGLIVFSDQSIDLRVFIRGMKRIDRFVPPEVITGELLWLDEWIT